MADTVFPVGEFLLNGAGKIDPPLPETNPETKYRLNHLCIRIRDPKKSLPFYIDLMGMRTVFVLNTGPFTIYYLGYPTTPEHRADLTKFASETFPVLQQTLGLIELYHVHGSENQEEGYYNNGSTPPGLGFGHIGFTVPDVQAAIDRLVKAGVKVWKPLGVSTREAVPLSDYELERGVGVGELHENYSKTFRQIGFVQDPDGYIVELVPQFMVPDLPN